MKIPHQHTLAHAGAQHTLEFVRAHLCEGATLLDVGCGDGIIARVLQDAGYKVTAIDAREDAVAEAKTNGVNAEQADFVEYKGQQFDAILCARSLHHIPLDAALTNAKTLLTAGGVLLLDEFGAELMDEKSAVWFYGLRSFLSSDHQCKSRGPKPEGGGIPEDPVKHWREHHFGKHHVATSEEMLAVIPKHFKIDLTQRVPYLYRYFTDDVSAAASHRLLRWEEALCAEGALTPIGLRIVAR